MSIPIPIATPAPMMVGLDLHLRANPQEKDSPNSSAPPTRTPAKKAAAIHFCIPALVTRSL